MQKNLIILISFILISLISTSCGKKDSESKVTDGVKQEEPLLEDPVEEKLESIGCIVRYEDEQYSPICVELPLEQATYETAVGFCMGVVARNGVAEIVDGPCPEVIE